MRTRPAAVIMAAALLGLALGGCGAGAGPGLSRAVSLRISTGFGSGQLSLRQIAHPPQGWSVMALTEKYDQVSTSDGGGFVDAIDDHANDDAGAEKLDWFFYVNGTEGGVGAAATQLHPGDQIIWDLHDWRAAESIPAIVGSYPEPFTSGAPTSVVCAGGAVQAACGQVRRALKRAGAKLSPSGHGPRRASIQVLVGTAAQLSLGQAGELLADAPSESGVYARFRHGGHALELENPAGHGVDTLYSAAGLIAALVPGGTTLPTWVITGTGRRGVEAAARALTSTALAGRFAVAVSGTGVLPLPQSPQS